MKSLLIIILSFVSIISFSQSKKELKSNLKEAIQKIESLDSIINQQQIEITNFYKSQFKPEPGKCYSRCKVSTMFEIINDSMVIFNYTGNQKDNQFVKEITITTKPGHTDWVRNKTDPDCLHFDQEYCDVWCLIEKPSETKTLKVVTDTSSLKEFEIIKIPISKLNSKSTFTDWREVVCGKGNN